MEMQERQDNKVRYFKFLHFWVENKNFMTTVQNCWDREVERNPIWKLHQKMKRLANTLSKWPKNYEYGDIYAKVKEFEDR